MINNAKLFFKGQYIFNTAWKHCGETYGIREEVCRMSKVSVKELHLIVKGTDRKRKEIERVVRQALDNYKERKGVYDLQIVEVNKTVLG